jgi:hypothetical protein
MHNFVGIKLFLFFLPPQDGFTPFLLSVIKKQSEYD